MATSKKAVEKSPAQNQSREEQLAMLKLWARAFKARARANSSVAKDDGLRLTKGLRVALAKVCNTSGRGQFLKARLQSVKISADDFQLLSYEDIDAVRRLFGEWKMLEKAADWYSELETARRDPREMAWEIFLLKGDQLKYLREIEHLNRKIEAFKPPHVAGTAAAKRKRALRYEGFCNAADRVKVKFPIQCQKRRGWLDQMFVLPLEPELLKKPSGKPWSRKSVANALRERDQV